MSQESRASKKSVVAFGLLTNDDLKVLGPSFQRVWPVDQTPCFGDLLRAVDEADRDIWRARDRGDA
jgi:hypothetical protein